MKFRIITTLLATLAVAQGNMRGAVSQQNSEKFFRLTGTRKYRVTVTNLSLDQSMSPFFAAVHTADTPRLYTFGQPSSDALALLAEDGNNAQVVDMFSQYDSVLSSASVTNGLLMGGEAQSFEVETQGEFTYLSLASMAVNTNDCFVAVAGTYIYDGASIMRPGLDSGTEENNELCTHVPGPACEGAGSGVRATENAEGFVHVHRGNQNIADLGPRYDWRNPMLSVAIQRIQ